MPLLAHQHCPCVAVKISHVSLESHDLPIFILGCFFRRLQAMNTLEAAVANGSHKPGIIGTAGELAIMLSA